MTVSNETAIRDSQRGMTLMEILLVIAIAGLLVAGGLILFVQAQSSGNTMRAQQQISNLSSSIRSLYAGQSTYIGLNAATLYANRAVPDDMAATDTSGSIYDVFGGQVAIGVGTACGNPPSGGTYSNGYFCLTMPTVPQESCLKLVQARIGAVAIAGNDNVNVNAVSINAAATAAAGQVIGTPANMCPNTNNSVKWVFAG